MTHSQFTMNWTTVGEFTMVTLYLAQYNAITTRLGLISNKISESEMSMPLYCFSVRSAITKPLATWLARASADLPPLALKFLPTLLCGVEKLGGKVCIACGFGSSPHSDDLIGDR
jgi:hypothetical protein